MPASMTLAIRSLPISAKNFDLVSIPVCMPHHDKQGFSPGKIYGIAVGRGLSGVCVHINHFGYHIKKIRHGGRYAESASGESITYTICKSYNYCPIVDIPIAEAGKTV